MNPSIKQDLFYHPDINRARTDVWVGGGGGGVGGGGVERHISSRLFILLSRRSAPSTNDSHDTHCPISSVTWFVDLRLNVKIRFAEKEKKEMYLLWLFPTLGFRDDSNNTGNTVVCWTRPRNETKMRPCRVQSVDLNLVRGK